VFAKAIQRALSWTRSRQSKPLHHISPRSHINIIDPLASWFSCWSPSFWLFHKSLICLSVLPHMCCMPRLSYHPWLDLPNYSWQEFVLWRSLLYSFLNLLSLHPPLAQILSAPCTQTPSDSPFPLREKPPQFPSAACDLVVRVPGYIFRSHGFWNRFHSASRRRFRR
jgi:hypothetical protein